MPNNEVKNFRWVYPGLAGSALPRTTDQIEWLRYEMNIRKIVSFETLRDSKSVIFAIQSLGIDHVDMHFPDATEPSDEEANKFVLIADECLAFNIPLLCHCLAGRGRTGTMLVYYLMTRFGYTLDEGLDAVLNTVAETDQVNFLYAYAQRLEPDRKRKKTLSPDLIAEYKALDLDQERSLIFWGGVLGIHGIRDTKDDLDVLVTQSYFQELLSKWHYSEDTPGKIVLGNIDICNSEAGLCDFADEAMRQGEMIDGMHFMSLQNLIRIKTARRRPKDLADVVMIYHYFRKNALK